MRTIRSEFIALIAFTGLCFFAGRGMAQVGGCTGTPPPVVGHIDECDAAHHCICVPASIAQPTNSCDPTHGGCQVSDPGCSNGVAWGTIHEGYCKVNLISEDGCAADAGDVPKLNTCYQCKIDDCPIVGRESEKICSWQMVGVQPGAVMVKNCSGT